METRLPFQQQKECVNFLLLENYSSRSHINYEHCLYKWKLDYLSNNKKCVNLKLLLQITYKPMNIVYINEKLDYLSNNKKCVNLKLLLQITVNL